MILKKIVHKAAQAFRLAQAADKKLSTGIAAALDAKAEQPHMRSGDSRKH